MADSQLPSQPQESSSVIYKVQIEVDGTRLGCGEFQGRIKLDMTGGAGIVTEQQRLLRNPVQKIRRTVRL